jgi:hypothetical protein
MIPTDASVTSSNGSTVQSSAATSTSDGNPYTSGGGIERVNAFDGLFLRAEHLDRMQDYAHELATAIGAAGGPGVVEGYGVKVEGKTLEVQPGLAVDPYGRPLRSRGTLTLDLTERGLSRSEFYYVEVTRAKWDFGNEAVQGVLCDDPCTGGGSARPYTAEGVLLQLVRAAEPQLEGVLDARRRSWLSSRLFATERRASDGWPDAAKPQLFLRTWSPAEVAEGRPTAVRLGVLIPSGNEGWLLDVWTARRDRGDPPPVREWQWRLGMRPWDVFIAQILQFQDMLYALWGDGSASSRASYVAELLGAIDAVGKTVMKVNRSVTREQLDALASAIRKGELGDAPAAATGAASLPSLGIHELPPAGFLPALGTQSEEELRNAITDLLGGEGWADVRVCTGAIGDVGTMITRAQHRDRITLAAGSRTPVDILVPGESGNSVFDWVVFARREEIDCKREPTEETMDSVDIYILDYERERELYDEYFRYIDARGDGYPPRLPDSTPITLAFPVRSWALPDHEEYAELVDNLRRLVFEGSEGSEGAVTVVAVVEDDARRPLGLTRAVLLSALSTEYDLEVPSVYSFIGTTEAIVILPKGRSE